MKSSISRLVNGSWWTTIGKWQLIMIILIPVVLNAALIREGNSEEANLFSLLVAGAAVFAVSLVFPASAKAGSIAVAAIISVFAFTVSGGIILVILYFVAAVATIISVALFIVEREAKKGLISRKAVRLSYAGEFLFILIILLIKFL